MEELASTEVIETEILDDARKKGERILRDADAEILRLGAESEKRRAAELAALDRYFEDRIRKHRTENEARLPLDKARMRISFLDRRLREGTEGFLARLDAPARAGLVAGLLSRASSLVGKAELAVVARGLSEDEARAILAKALPGASMKSFSPSAELAAEGLVVETLPPRIKIRATLDLVSEDLLDLRRGELCAALEGLARKGDARKGDALEGRETGK